jgi:copper chaperone CopZ
MTTPTIDIAVGGMTCHHCVMTISKELTGLPGVADATVDLDAKRATVHPDGSVPAAKVEAAARAAINELGYEALV